MRIVQIAESVQTAVERLHAQGLSPAEIAAEMLRRGRYISENGVVSIIKQSNTSSTNTLNSGAPA